MNEVTTPQVSSNDTTPQTRDTLLKDLNASIDTALESIRDMRASLAIDGPMLNPEPQYTKEKLAKMLREAYDLGATAHEENMTVDGGRYGDIEVRIEVSEGGFRYHGDANVDSDVIKECISFEDHNMTDEQVDEILNS
jgi:hypothetical protein